MHTVTTRASLYATKNKPLRTATLRGSGTDFLRQVPYRPRHHSTMVITMENTYAVEAHGYHFKDDTFANDLTKTKAKQLAKSLVKSKFKSIVILHEQTFTVVSTFK